MNNEQELSEVTEYLLQNATDRIPLERVKKWMVSENIEVLGAAFSILHNPEHYSRITPPLAFSDYHPFHLRYYARCLRENPDGTWTPSRYIAAHSLVAWFTGLFRDPNTPKEALADLKSLLARVFIEGDEAIRDCVITGALEHLFQNRAIRHLFDDWRQHEILGIAYAKGRNCAIEIQSAQN